MNNLFIDCSFGVSGDMLLAGLLDMGVPLKILDSILNELGIDSKVAINSKELISSGFKGLRVSVNELEKISIGRSWTEIREFLLKSKLKEEVKSRALNVFRILAESEASIHGLNLDEVHFHEIGSISTIVNIVCVCKALKYLDIDKIFCTIPPAGSGTVNTKHGELSVPVPVVLELAKNHQIKLSGTIDQNLGELTTPSGLALLIEFVDSFSQPDFFFIKSIGVGLGERQLEKPNLLRVCLLDADNNHLESSKGLIKSNIISQEAWIDDASSEDIALLMTRLRENGAIEVVSQSVNMKKGRTGISVKVLVSPDDAQSLRYIWFTNSSTIGIRERLENRWLLQRRIGSCMTTFGKVPVKQVKRPDGRYTLKPEFDELSNLSRIKGIPIQEIRDEILSNADKFISEEEWRW